MALTSCPECGKEISDRAPACVHCGYPMPRPRPGGVYSLVLLEQEPFPNETRSTMLRLGMSEKKADRHLNDLPAALWMGLSLEEAYQKAEAFRECGVVKVIRDENALTKASIRQTPPVAYFGPEPRFPFWSVVGAVFTALLLWSILRIFLPF